MGPVGSYFRASLRLWRKQWVGVLIAIAGLVGALAISLITAAYFYNGLTSDRWLETSDRLYRVNQDMMRDGAKMSFSNPADTTLAVGPLLLDSNPEIEAFTRIRGVGVKTSTENVQVSKRWYAIDKGFADVVPLNMVAGTLENTLEAPFRLALSETEAEKYGGLAAVGKTITAVVEGAEHTYEIAAIYEDIPVASHFRGYEVLTLLHDTTMPSQEWMKDWAHAGTYVLLHEGVDAKRVVKTFGASFDPVMPPQHDGQSFVHELVPVFGLLLSDKSKYGMVIKGPYDQNFLYGLLTVSVVLLASAGFNFVTVFTAINLMRGREVAVRRLSGASGRKLFQTAWVESGLLVLLAFALALLLAVDLAPLAEDFVNGQVGLFELAKLPLFIAAITVLFAFSLLASSYASAVVLRKRPAELMRDSQGSVTGGGTRMRQSLVFVQALVLTTVLGAAAQIQIQTNHLLTMDRGITQSGLMFIDGPRHGSATWGEDPEKMKADNTRFRESFRMQVSGLEGVTGTATMNMRPFHHFLFIYRMRNPQNNELQEVSMANVGPDYFDLAGVRVLAKLDGDITQIKSPVALDQTMLRSFGFATPEAAIGYDLISERETPGGEVKKTNHKIVAVIKDIKDKGDWMTEKKVIYGLEVNTSIGSATIALKYDVRYEGALREAVANVWREHFHDADLTVNTIEELVSSAHTREQDSSIAVSIIAALCAVLGFAGLYGMSAHWLSTRQRELALRRVLGASRKSVSLLACRKMLAPVVAGALLGAVPAWWVSRQWLEQFTEQMPVPAVAYSGFILLIVVFAAFVLMVNIRLALSKRPADVLYHE